MSRFQYIGILIFTCLAQTPKLKGQENQSEHSFDSYISNMQSVIIDSFRGNWISDNIIHNRINYFWYPNKYLIFSAQMRNRIVYGETVKYNPGYASSIDNDQGYMDLSMNLFNENSFFINTSLDRLFLKYTQGNLVMTIGRQRINWGQNYVWNPNDIFNVQNFFDFDYIEKPGSDAIRLQYYTGVASEADIAMKLDHNQKLTSAAFYRFNKWGYDFQVLGGVFEGVDYFAGGGFAGHIYSAGINGEFSFFKPIENFKDTSFISLFGIGIDYRFSNSIYLQVEGLYQYSSTQAGIKNFLSWYSGNLNVKKLSFTDFSVFSNVTYSFTPLLTGSLACMVFPEIEGFFTGPTISYSLSERMEFSLIAQAFSGILPDVVSGIKARESLFMGFIRYKLNF